MSDKQAIPHAVTWFEISLRAMIAHYREQARPDRSRDPAAR